MSKWTKRVDILYSYRAPRGFKLDPRALQMVFIVTSWTDNLQHYMAAPAIRLWSRLAFDASPDTELRSSQRVILCAEPSILRRL
ncbi:unnamed protein product [Penicillium camemberti]|uniref:Str. FM013 n=1 Tax=Penicillium camemberti (strain FM 013) TaxID=1429867 RepID=A0A0G4P8P7_PENC3|nr:unnamed protein product [Penicillium camemberti]